MRERRTYRSCVTHRSNEGKKVSKLLALQTSINSISNLQLETFSSCGNRQSVVKLVLPALDRVSKLVRNVVKSMPVSFESCHERCPMRVLSSLTPPTELSIDAPNSDNHELTPDLVRRQLLGVIDFEKLTSVDHCAHSLEHKIKLDRIYIILV